MGATGFIKKHFLCKSLRTWVEFGKEDKAIKYMMSRIKLFKIETMNLFGNLSNLSICDMDIAINIVSLSSEAVIFFRKGRILLNC